MPAIALVTGATAGIGRELVRLLARDGRSLALVARDAARLSAAAAEARELGAPEVLKLVADLEHPGAPEEIVRALAERGLVVDTLVNNAGFGAHGPFAERDVAAQVGMVQVNVAAVVELTRRLLPPMLAAGSGRILNVASTAAFQPGPYLAVYYATKAFVVSFSEALAVELAGSGVTVTCLCPGPTATEFQARSGLDRLELLASRRLVMANAESVARAGLRGMLAGRRRVIPGWLNRVGVALVKLAPSGLAARVVARYQRR